LRIECSHNDCELLALIKTGDKEAFAMLYQRYWRDLYDTAYQRLKNPQQAEDIVQDVFVSVWSRRSDLNINNPAAYLHTAVRFKIFNYVERDLACEAFLEPFESIIAYQSGADDQLMGKELIRLIQLFANTLPNKRKQIFLLHLSQNFTTREIAEQLHINQKTVQNQLGRALDGLKTRLATVGVLFICCFLF
jgi:RNA polymerase sigma-70 factor (family 1)